jgi:hypothetical protein
MRKLLFYITYFIIHIAPLYALVAIFFLQSAQPGWIALVPIIVVFVPAGIYLASIRCPVCKSPVYTPDHLRASPKGLYGIPMHIFHECPECGSGLGI